MDKSRIIEDFHEGHCIDAYHLFGAHFSYEGKEGVRFTVYAPHAAGVSVIGSFNGWDPHKDVMTRTDFKGVWSVFVENAKEWDSYKYHIQAANGTFLDKADPYAFYSETRPSTASKVYNFHDMDWSDEKWMRKRTKNFDRPVSIYEVHAGGWKHDKDDNPYTYNRLKDELIPYVKENGFTHIEFLPLTEYPYDGSWGYQASGYYSVTSRYGNPTEFASLVNECHRHGIGVIMDMVPVHFVKDSYGLIKFDGAPLYEYKKREDAESSWGTLNFDLWNEEVRSFLISASLFWCDVYHIDGIRMDAVANIIYWQGDSTRGENQGALDFIRRMNYYIAREYPSVMLIAEDSSAYPKVTVPTIDGGLGFDYKWDLGWMNDTLSYYSEDPLYRGSDHNKITFSMAYFYSERFLLPLSHDENVHGKKTIIDRMFGTYEQKFAQVKNLYAYMYAHPGKKLNFMGNEIASFREFDEAKQLDWFLLKYPVHDAFHRYFRDLNLIYLAHSSLFQYDYDWHGFQWIDASDSRQSIYSFYRQSDSEYLVCILNMTRASYENFNVSVPAEGTYTEILNSEKDIYGGCNDCNFTPVKSWRDQNHAAPFENYITIRIAPFAAVWFITQRGDHRKQGEGENV